MDYSMNFPTQTPKSFKRDYLIYIFAFLIFVLVGLVIYFALKNQNTKSTYIEPTKCPVIKSNYASLPNVNPNYTDGTLVYTSNFPISAYPNALLLKLLNNGTNYGSANVTLTQKSVTLTGTTGINNGLKTILIF